MTWAAFAQSHFSFRFQSHFLKCQCHHFTTFWDLMSYYVMARHVMSCHVSVLLASLINFKTECGFVLTSSQSHNWHSISSHVSLCIIMNRMMPCWNGRLGKPTWKNWLFADSDTFQRPTHDHTQQIHGMNKTIVDNKMTVKIMETD